MWMRFFLIPGVSYKSLVFLASNADVLRPTSGGGSPYEQIKEFALIDWAWWSGSVVFFLLSLGFTEAPEGWPRKDIFSWCYLATKQGLWKKQWSRYCPVQCGEWPMIGWANEFINYITCKRTNSKRWYKQQEIAKYHHIRSLQTPAPKTGAVQQRKAKVTSSTRGWWTRKQKWTRCVATVS